MNQFTRACVVKGVSYFADKIDGEAVNSGAVFIEEALDERTGRAKGFRTVEYRCPDSEIPRSLIHNTFPLACDVTFEITTSKRAQTVTVAAVKPQARASQQPSPIPKAV